MPPRTEYSLAIKEAVINALKKGMSQSAVANNFGISQQLISVWYRWYMKTGNLNNKSRSGRPRKTSAREDRIIKKQSVADPQKSARQIRDDLEVNHGVKLHVSTVKRRLVANDLHGRRPSRKPLISSKNKKARLQFAEKFGKWSKADWSKVLWSDESKFNLFSSDGIKYVRRPKNKRNDVRYQVPTVKHGGGNVMVWGCFSRSGVGPLVKIEGKMDRFAYRKILEEHMIPHAKRNMPRNWLFQHDNDPKHSSGHVKELFVKKKIKVLEWPSQSPDVNPIEHLWDELDRRVRVKKCSNVQSFFEALKEEWSKIPQERLAKLVDSMPDRCSAVIKAKGYATSY